MHIRMAILTDLNFLIEGLEANRIIENRDASEIKAKASDIADLKNGIEKQTILLAEEGNKAIGFLHYKTNFEILYLPNSPFWIDLVFVIESERGKGIGNKLYKKAIQIAKDSGYENIILDIFEANTISKKFHDKLGFKPVYSIYSLPIEKD